MSQRYQRDAYSAKPEPEEVAKATKGCPTWLVCIMIVVCVAGLVAGLTTMYRAGDAAVKERDARRQSLSENELGIFQGSGVFHRDQYWHPMAREVEVQGWTNTGEEMRVLVSSVDNITVEYRADGKDFATIRLIGWMPDGTAEGAVILVPANDASYYESVRREVHAKHASYENCPKCNPGKK